METLQSEQNSKDQLLTEDQFIQYCRTAGVYDEIALLRNFDEIFLKALRKDGLISPIFEQKNESGIIDYYSKFQVFIVLALRVNIVDADGNLRDPQNIEWQIERKQRHLRWCQTGFLYLDVASSGIFNCLEICKKFHRFLLFLQSCNLTDDRYELVEKRRMYVGLPPLHYDFSSLTEESLNSFGITVEDLKLLRSQIGSEARYIDPLKEWYLYVEKHPQTKKDLLRGEAAFAQRCYEICDIITLVLAKITGEEPRSLVYYLKSLNNPSAYHDPYEYVHGVDTYSLLHAIEKFREWSFKPENQEYVTTKEIKKVEDIKLSIDDYIDRYGHRTWAGNHFRIEIDPDITADKLDDNTRMWLDKFRAQKSTQDREFNEPGEIAFLIHSRLSDIQRSLRTVFSEIQNKFRDRSNDIWEREERHDLWGRYWPELSKMAQKERIEFVDNKRKEIRAQIEYWDKLATDFYSSAFRFCGLAFCKVCHKNPIEIHVGHNDRSSTSIYESVICDSCKASAPYIHRKEDLPAGLNCYGCGKLVYRYVHDNHFFSEEKVPLTKEEMKEIQKEEGVRGSVVRYHKQSIEVPYGKVNCAVTCGFCGTKNVYNLEYGWRE
ncbi:MAG TPA: hypothetical protein PK295_00505 [Candidatus Magasanikbacteria bacterium]|nr:hypothetical protein [Candidatus Magasanikbacteria bacterium]